MPLPRWPSRTVDRRRFPGSVAKPESISLSTSSRPTRYEGRLPNAGEKIGCSTMNPLRSLAVSALFDHNRAAVFLFFLFFPFFSYLSMRMDCSRHAGAAVCEPPARTFMNRVDNFTREGRSEQRFVNKVANFVREASGTGTRSRPAHAKRKAGHPGRLMRPEVPRAHRCSQCTNAGSRLLTQPPPASPRGRRRRGHRSRRPGHRPAARCCTWS